MATVSDKLVYLLQRGHEFKIGHTANLKQRLAMLSTGSAVKLTVVHTIKTEKNAELENLLKNRYIANRLRGEWYLLNDSAVRFIMGITTWPRENGEPLDFSSMELPSRGSRSRRIAQPEIAFVYPEPISLMAPVVVVEATTRDDMSVVGSMTLRELIESRTDIRTPGGLRENIPDMSRQQAWLLWHGKTTLGLRTAKRIAEATKIPLEDLAEVDEAVPGKPRQRKRQEPPDGAP